MVIRRCGAVVMPCRKVHVDPCRAYQQLAQAPPVTSWTSGSRTTTQASLNTPDRRVHRSQAFSQGTTSPAACMRKAGMFCGLTLLKRCVATGIRTAGSAARYVKRFPGRSGCVGRCGYVSWKRARVAGWEMSIGVHCPLMLCGRDSLLRDGCDVEPGVAPFTTGPGSAENDCCR